MEFKPGDIIQGPIFGGSILAMVIMPRPANSANDGHGYRIYILDDETGYWNPGSIHFLHTKRVSFYELVEGINNES